MTPTGIVAVDELARAYQAALQGEFRTGLRRRRTSCTLPAPGSSWSPAASERVLLVTGCGGSAGVSTVALALASCAGDARVVECCTVAASGLAAASSAELGSTDEGWLQGSRGLVLIERRSDRVAAVESIPVPAATTRPLTVLDCSWEVDLLVASEGWLGEVARTVPSVVVVTRPTVPGMRRLEAALALFGEDRVQVVVVGVDRRWPRRVEHALGPAGRRLRAAGRVIGLPVDLTLSVEGITPDPLPTPILASCFELLTTLKGTF